MIRHGGKLGSMFSSRVSKPFSTGRSMAGGGIFAGIGAVGKRNVSTMDPKVLARSGKIRSAMVAGGGIGMGAMNKRRGPGTSKTSGRPTGMYGY